MSARGNCHSDLHECERKGGEMGRSGNEDSLGYDMRFAIKACRAAAKGSWEGAWLQASPLRTNPGKRSEELGRRDVLSS